MAKRGATTELNHDNWDREEEPEEIGVFRKADSDVLQQRVIKTAKRRVARSGDDEKPKAFSGFSGFSNTNSSLSSSPFSFLSQNAKPKPPEEKNASELNKNMFSMSKDSEPQAKLFSNAFPKENNSISNSKSSETVKTDTFKTFENIFKPKENDNKKSQNLEILKDLNLSCSNWIAENLEKNPYCILTPIFKDYEKHLAKLDLKLDSNSKEEKHTMSMNSLPDNSSKLFSINPVAKIESTEEKKEQNKVETASKPTFQFSSGSLGSVAPIPFGGVFSSVPTFNLNQISKPPETDGETKNDEESDEPPKNEFVPVVEDDSIFDIRCKVFIKKDGDYVPKGVGTLFIKPVKGGNRNQLIVRADTSLGNILLNFLLTPSLAIQKMGKNNVMVVCLPTPESKPPPVPVLIRVKTSEDCDRVIEKLEECKGS